MKKPWIICALMGWGLFALAMFTPQQAPAQQGKGSGGGGDEGGVAAASPCVGDVNNNGVVNIDDLVLVITNWGMCPGCQTASQCNDSNPCTTDTCQFSVCVHTPIPNCVTCTSNAQCANAFPNAQGICQGNQCVMGPCSMGYGNCNMSTADGCEVFVQGDPNNCGTCNAPCVFANAQAMCVNSQCVMGSCNAGFADCNGMFLDGCEVNLLTDPSNCGLCGLSVNDGNPCTFDSCTNGVPMHQVAPNNFPCGPLLNCQQPVCMNGNCVPMNAPNNTVCAPATQCASFFCNNGVCTQVNQPNGTPCGIGQQCMNGVCQ